MKYNKFYELFTRQGKINHRFSGISRVLYYQAIWNKLHGICKGKPKKLISSFLAIFFLFLSECSLAEPKPEKQIFDETNLTILTWNIHNLFDGVDDGTEYDEFLLSSSWSVEKYKGRINSISSAISVIKPLPDIILLQELENLKILEDLANSISKDYQWCFFSGNPESALGVGIISRLPILETRNHSITIYGETTPRPVLESRILAGEEEFVIFVCHWKSKLGGDAVTENDRKASARVILRRIRELMEKEPDLGFFIAGDLNENYDEFFRQKAEIVCALLPDDPFGAQMAGCSILDGIENASAQKDFIVISKNKPPVPVYFPPDAITLFSPWLSDLENGSYYYKYNWETIDHFLISPNFFDNNGLLYDNIAIVNYQPFINASGAPFPYNIKTGIGLSDHLPLILTLRKSNNDE